MGRYILTYQGYGEAPEKLVTRLCGEPDVRVVERIGDDLVVEGPRDALTDLFSDLSGWFTAPERRVRQPRLYASS